MKKLKFLCLLALIVIVGCKSDDDSNNNDDQALYTFINNGTGAVSSIQDTDDTVGLDIAQAVPAVQNEAYPNSLPILLFFNDKLYLNSLEDNFEVTQNGTIVGGTIAINEGANGYAILTFIPKTTFDANATVVLTLKNGLQDDGGNNFLSQTDYSLTFQTNSQNSGDFSDNGSFENSNDGVLFVGDGNILEGAQGCVSSTDGNSFAAITSGDMLVSSDSAIGGASSMMILGAIDSGISSLSFDYNFLSSEFLEFVDSEFDDSVVVTIVGSSGAHSEFLTSVNTVGIDNTQCEGFAGMPDDGDEYAGETGWNSKTINFSNVGDNAFIIFTITDVADTIYSSALTVDNVTFN
jgi:hypothetical protein